ncbi:MAG: HlyC/CorC family transporter [Microthrixaceae bacterium]|nr:HlyC/CorC family transporter [Microthrixaceae bacterium]
MIAGALVASLLLVVLNGVFVATEFALLASLRTRLELLAEEGRFGASRALSAMSSLGPMLAGTQLGITMASLGLGSVAEPAVEDLLDRLGEAVHLAPGVARVAAVALSLGVVVFMHLVVGEMMPKSIALAAPEKTLMALVLPVAAFAWMLRPVIWMLNVAARLGARTLGAEPADELRSSHTAAELTAMIEESGEEGLIEGDELELVTRALELVGRAASGIMVPRERIVAVDRGSTVEEAESAVRASGHSRILVTAGDLDHVMGFVHVKDLLDLPESARAERLAVRIRSHLVIDGTESLGDVLVTMQSRRIHMAVVTDEHDRTVGMVTLEDILESVVGDILDESDPEA